MPQRDTACGKGREAHTSIVAERARDARAPELAVVVFSYDNEDTIVAAVQSLLDQDVALEIVVSHSGGGSTPELVAAAHPGVTVLATDRRRLPGEARNAGAAATRARWVAFLEGDSFAQPGWAAARLARHRSGAMAVSGAVVPDSLVPAAIAAHLQRNRLRMPHMPAPRPHLRFTVSLERGLLDDAGPFPEDMPRSEDTVLNTRLVDRGVEIGWAPEVVIATKCPRSAGALVREQVRRGRLWGSVAGGAAWRIAGAAQAFADALAGVGGALRRGSPVPREAVIRALPHVAIGAAATAVGRLLGGPPSPGDYAAANAARAARLRALRQAVRPTSRRR